ncbi:hypothetical protein DBR43_07625 [Pedobacter sp. KBW06]|nr:hypothetical protein DBR43_07625 [Pedobacter sp. KBW06]
MVSVVFPRLPKYRDFSKSPDQISWKRRTLEKSYHYFYQTDVHKRICIVHFRTTEIIKFAMIQAAETLWLMISF